MDVTRITTLGVLETGEILVIMTSLVPAGSTRFLGMPYSLNQVRVTTVSSLAVDRYIWLSARPRDESRSTNDSACYVQLNSGKFQAV